MAGGFDNRRRAKFERVTQCPTSFFVRDAMGQSVFLGRLSNVKIFVFCAKIDISRKKYRKRRPARIAQCTNVQSAKRSAVEHQTGFRSDKYSPHGEVWRTPGRAGVWGHLRRRGAIHQMMPRVPFGPSGGYSVLLFTFLHSVHGVSQRGSVSVGSGVRGRLPLSCVAEPRTRPLSPASGGLCAASRARRRDRRCVVWARWRRPRRVRRLSSGILHQGVESGCQPTVCRVMEDLVVGGLRSAQPLPGVDADCEQR